MTHITDIANIHLLRKSVVSIGVFDGVHRGHQHLVRRLVKEAHASDKLAVVLTFFPHPDVVLRGIDGRYYLTTAEERAQLLLDLGVDYVVTHPFDDRVRHIRAADFVDMLISHLKVAELWVGEDFALGYEREGNVTFLREQGKAKDFSVHAVDLVQAEATGEAISSTLIRQALAEGKVDQVRAWLGRSYSVTGEVIHGKNRGQGLGYPTANIAVWDRQIVPMNGVYAGWAYLGEERFMAMTNVGISPQFMNAEVSVEPHILDFDRNIYGQPLKITFEKFLRPEARFDGIDELIIQIGRDVEAGRIFLNELAKQQDQQG